MIPVYLTYLTRPISPPIYGIFELDPSKIVEPMTLIFRVEEAGYSMFPASNPTHLYRYYCESCYYASGERERVFRTTPASTEKMKDGPTKEQQEQMSDHSRQHEIMWQWAKGLEKQ